MITMFVEIIFIIFVSKNATPAVNYTVLQFIIFGAAAATAHYWLLAAVFFNEALGVLSRPKAAAATTAVPVAPTV